MQTERVPINIRWSVCLSEPTYALPAELQNHNRTPALPTVQHPCPQLPPKPTMNLAVPLAGAVVALSLLWWRWSTRRPAGAPPGPGPALPLVGHLYLLTKDPRAQFRAWRRKYGEVFSLVLGNQLTVVLNGYGVIKEALVKQADAFSDRPKNSMFDLVTKAKGEMSDSCAACRDRAVYCE